MGSKPKKQSGFSLIEVLVTLLVFGILAGMAYEAFLSQAEAFKQQQRRVNRQQVLRAALEALGRDLRLAGYPEGKVMGRLWAPGWIPSSYLPSGWARPTGSDPVMILPGGSAADGLVLLTVLPGETNPTVLRNAVGVGETVLALVLNTGETGDQYRPGDLIYLGRPPEFARVERLMGRDLVIDTDPQQPGLQGLEQAYPAGTELGEVSLVSYAVFNDANDPGGRSHEPGRPVLKRKVNAGGFEPLVEDIDTLKVQVPGPGQYEIRIGALLEPGSPATASFRELVTRVANRNSP